MDRAAHLLGLTRMSVLSFPLILLAIAMLAVTCSAIEYHSDVQLSGSIENQTIDIWGNITVDGSLTLRNVTVKFHSTGNEQPRIYAGTGARLWILDNDGLDDTTADRTVIDSVGGPWQLVADDADIVTVDCSELRNMGTSSSTSMKEGAFHIFSRQIQFTRSLFVNISGWSLLTCSELLFMQNTTWDGEDMNIWVSSPYVSAEGSSYSGGAVYLIAISSTTKATFSDCEFHDGKGKGVIAGDKVEFRNCTFYDLPTGIYASSGASVDVYGCSFNRCTTMFDGERDVTSYFQDSNFSRGVFGANITLKGVCGFLNCTFSDLNNAVCLNNITSSWFTACVFRDIKESAVYCIRNEWTVRCVLSSCEIDNVSIGVQVIRPDVPQKWVAVTVAISQCKFTRFDLGVNVTSSCLAINDSLFSERLRMGDPSTAIRTAGADAFSSQHFHQMDNLTIVNCTTGIHIDNVIVPSSDGATVLAVFNTKMVHVSVGLVGSPFELLLLDMLSFVDCEMAMQVMDVRVLSLGAIVMRDCAEGLHISHCERVLMDGQLNASSIEGMVVTMDNVDNSTWNIAGPTQYDSCNFRIVGTINVRSSLVLRDSTFYLYSIRRTTPTVSVFPGAEFKILRSSIVGVSSTGFVIHLHSQSHFQSEKSNLLRGGFPSVPRHQMAISAYDAIVLANDTYFSECPVAISASDSTVELRNCTINTDIIGMMLASSHASLMGTTIKAPQGVDLSSSHVRIDMCRITSVYQSLKAFDSDLQITACQLSSSVDGIILSRSKAVMDDIDVSTGGVLLRLTRTMADLHNSTLWSSGNRYIVENVSTLRLFNAYCKGEWQVLDPESRVEEHFTKDLLVRYNWTSEPCSGLPIRVIPASAKWPETVVLTDDNGSIRSLWLVDSVMLSTGRIVIAPYRFEYADEGLWGEESSVGGTIWSGVLVIHDASPPQMRRLRPHDGLCTNRPNVTVEGSYSELGSGLSSSSYSMDGGEWIAFGVAMGKWSVEISAADGPHELSVMLSDRDGHSTSLVFRFTVDTRPPAIAFTSPENGSYFPVMNLTISGFASIGNGTGFAYLLLNGEPVSLDGDGFFSSFHTLRREGTHVFVLDAMDVAGNVAKESLFVFVDTTPPFLHIDDFTSLVNDPNYSMTGYAEDINGLVLIVDGEPFLQFKKSRFTIPLNLSEGANVVEITVVDQVGNEASVRLNVTLDSVLNASILEPRPGDTLTDSNVTVVVRTDPDAFARVRPYEEWLSPAPDGNVTFHLVLGIGRQTLEIEVLDDASNRVLLELPVTVGNVDDGKEPSDENIPRLVVVIPLFLLVMASLLLFLLGRRRMTRS